MPTNLPSKWPKKPADESKQMRIADACCLAALGLVFFLFSVLVDTGMSDVGLGYYRFFTLGIVVIGCATFFAKPPR